MVPACRRSRRVSICSGCRGAPGDRPARAGPVPAAFPLLIRYHLNRWGVAAVGVKHDRQSVMAPCVFVGYGRGVTVVIAVKVFDGIVLAADSATTLPLPNGSSQVYNHANKIFHLHRKRPVAAATWGLGTIGAASISTLAKDLRGRFMGTYPDHADWELKDGYTVQSIAERLVQMFFDELYSPLVASGQQVRSPLGFLVAGYGADSSGSGWAGELWKVEIDDPSVRPIPQLLAGSIGVGWVAHAIDEAAVRLFNGCDPTLLESLRAVIDPAQMPAVEQVLGGLMRQPVTAGMPFADAIKLAQFLADTTIGYTHYLLGPDVVGGPVEIAGISRHEGFKWIHRKHYYPRDLNPEDPGHDV